MILKDVLGHSLEQIASITGTSTPAAKSALQRGRLRLRELASERENAALPQLSDATRARLTAYVDGFIAGDFDAVRAMLAEDVRLDLVARLQRQGKSEVGEYLGRYAATVPRPCSGHARLHWSTATQRCSSSTASCHSRRQPISSRSTSMATASCRSTIFCSHDTRWSEPSCASSHSGAG